MRSAGPMLRRGLLAAIVLPALLAPAPHGDVATSTEVDAGYVDMWHYGEAPQLYVFSGTEYGRYDILQNRFMGRNAIAAGYPGLAR